MYIDSERYEENIPNENENSEDELFLLETEEYLNKIVELCRENNIELILVKTPIPIMTMGMHKVIMNYSEEQGIRFYDFNEKQICDEIHFNYIYDMNDSLIANLDTAHANFSGARKMTQYR